MGLTTSKGQNLEPTGRFFVPSEDVNSLAETGHLTAYLIEGLAPAVGKRIPLPGFGRFEVTSIRDDGIVDLTLLPPEDSVASVV